MKKRILSPVFTGGVPEVTPAELYPVLEMITLIDVRRPEEFTGELGHVTGAKLVTLGPALDAFLKSHDPNDEIAFICRSGARSGQATLQAMAAGYSRCVNMQGGMLAWNQQKLPVEERG